MARWLLACAAAVVGALASGAGLGVADATFGGQSGLLAYTSDGNCEDDFREPGGCPEVYIEVADPRNPRSRHAAAACGEAVCRPRDVSWSPTGKLLLYDDLGEVFLSRRNGSQDRLVVDNADQPAWSANGRRLVFTRSGNRAGSRSFREELFVQPVKGGPARRITRGGGLRADWSSRGEIAFQRYVGGFKTDVFRVLPNGRGLRRLTRGGSSGFPSWSPDGRLLAIERRSGFRKVNVVVIDRRGRVRRTLTRKGGVRPVWSPDGSRIAFSRGSKLYTVRARGGSLRRILPGASLLDGPLAWQPRPRGRP